MDFHFYDLPINRTYLRLNDNFRINLFKDIKGKFNSLSELAKFLDCCPESITNWEGGKCAIPTEVITKITKSLKNKGYNLNLIESNITAIMSGRKTRKQGSIGKALYNPKFPLRINTKLSRIVANFLGDGTINKNWYYNTIYFNKEIKLIDKLKDDLLEAFGKFKFNINKGKDNVYYLNVPSIIGMILYSWFGDFTSNKARIPNHIQNADEEIQCSFLQGLYDDEGTLDVKRKQIRLASSSKDLVEGVSQIFSNLKIKDCKIIKINYITKINKLKRESYNLPITNIQSILAFENKIGFIHPLKKRNLEILCDKIKSRIKNTDSFK